MADADDSKPAGATYESKKAQAIDDTIQWLCDQLDAQSVASEQEGDLDSRGARAVIGWLTRDLETFEGKFAIILVFCPDLKESVHLRHIGDQLHRLIWRCKIILGTGEDPIENEPFTKGNHQLIWAKEGDVDKDHRAFKVLREENGAELSDEEKRRGAAEMRRRLDAVGAAIRQVSRWIERREYDF